jgi:hypothetical protein
MRWHILRTLLYKELLRYRYNWGLSALVLALLALTVVTSVSVRMGNLPGQDEDLTISQCHVCYDGDSAKARSWADYLRQHPPLQPAAPVYHDRLGSTTRHLLEEDPRAMVIELNTEGTAKRPDFYSPVSKWQATYCYRHIMRRGMFTYRDWFSRHTQQFLEQSTLLDEGNVRFPENTALGNPVGTFMAALLIFALYLLSFNLYLTSTGEEREKRILLALLLTPATPVEILGAKALFHAAASLAMAAMMVGIYRPTTLLNPLLWSTAVMGSVGYVAVGTIAICLIRRQSTISMVSLLYLVGTTLILLLGKFMPLFDWARYYLLENYLYEQWLELLAIQPFQSALHNQFHLLLVTSIWSIIAVWLFARRGIAFARGG